METNHVIDLRGNGCTGAQWTDCIATTNTTNGTVVNPVKSGRINTKLRAWIKYGRVEVIAKLPVGDWLWPAIWMVPKDNAYGAWPRSGEIDILESRGNNASYEQGGNNIMSSTIHFGPSPQFNGWWRNTVKRKALHTTYSNDYNTFGVEVGSISLTSMYLVAHSIIVFDSGVKITYSHTSILDFYKFCSYTSTRLSGTMANFPPPTAMAPGSKIHGNPLVPTPRLSTKTFTLC